MSIPPPRIGILLGSTRAGRFSERPAQWLVDLGSRRADLCFEIVDLRLFPLPFFDEPLSPIRAPATGEQAQRWARKLAELDGLVIVTPEYNHGPAAVLKNALDYAYQEFNRKPVAFVGYGGVGAARAIEQLRLVAVELQMAPLRHAVHLGMVEFFGMVRDGKSFDDFPHLATTANIMLDDLAWWTHALRAARQTASGSRPPA